MAAILLEGGSFLLHPQMQHYHRFLNVSGTGLAASSYNLSMVYGAFHIVGFNVGKGVVLPYRTHEVRLMPPLEMGNVKLVKGRIVDK